MLTDDTLGTNVRLAIVAKVFRLFLGMHEAELVYKAFLTIISDPLSLLLCIVLILVGSVDRRADAAKLIGVLLVVYVVYQILNFESAGVKAQK